MVRYMGPFSCPAQLKSALGAAVVRYSWSIWIVLLVMTVGIWGNTAQAGAANPNNIRLHSDDWIQVPTPLSDTGTLHSVFRLNPDAVGAQSRIWLTGLGSTQHTHPEFALVYETILSGFWPTSRILLAAPVAALPTELLSQAKIEDDLALLPLQKLDRPLTDQHTYSASMAYNRSTGELAVLLQDDDTTLFAGYLKVNTLPPILYGSSGVTVVPGAPLNPDWQIELLSLTTDAAYTRYGPPAVLATLEWRLIAAKNAAAVTPLTSTRLSATDEAELYIEWPAVPVPGALELHATDINGDIVLAQAGWQSTPVRLPLTPLPPGSYQLALWYVEEEMPLQLAGDELQVLAGFEQLQMTIAQLDPTDPLWAKPLSTKLVVKTTQAVYDVDLEIVGTVTGDDGQVETQIVLERVHVDQLPAGTSQIELQLQPPELTRSADILVAPRVYAVTFGPPQRLRVSGPQHLGALELRLENTAPYGANVIPNTTENDMRIQVRANGDTPADAVITIQWLATNGPYAAPGASTPMQSVTHSLTIPSDQTTSIPITIPSDIQPGWYTLQAQLEDSTTHMGNFYLGIPTITQKEIQLADGVFSLNNTPVYWRGIGFYDYTQRPASQWKRDLDLYASWGMNMVEVFALPAGAATFKDFLDTAQAAGIYVAVQIDNSICNMPAKQRNVELLPFLAHWDHPSLIAWLLRDDTFYDQHYTTLVDITGFIRQFDTQTPITSTMLDVRVAERLSPQQWANWAGLLDFPVPYDYPVLRDGKVFNPMHGTTGGLETVQVLADRTRTVWQDPELYMWQWVQSHSQRVTINDLDFVATESYTSTPDQLQLLTYYLLTAGVRGQLYYRDRFFTDEHFGVGRRYQLQLMWRVLGEVEDILAAAKPISISSHTSAVAEVTSYLSGTEQLVLIAQHQAGDVRFVGTGEITPFTITLPVSNPACQAYLLQPIGVTPLESAYDKGMLTFTTPALDLTGTILVTDDDVRVTQIEDALQAHLSETAKAALFVLADNLAKISAVSTWLPVLPDYAAVLPNVAAIYRQSLSLYQTGAWTEAYLLTLNAGEQLRSLAQAQLKAADTTYLAGANRKYLASYFSLPKYYGHMDSLINAVTQKLVELTGAL
jgi:hypothetical protein